MKNGKIVVISGPSGVGKGTVLGIMMEKRKDLSFSVSATTRDPRPGEVDGVHYYFVTREKFEELIATGQMLEYDQHNAHYYGTPRAQAEEKQSRGHVLLDIEPAGAKQVKAAASDAVLFFIMPPSMEELERRLTGRGDTSAEQIKMRMERALWEMDQKEWYDYTVVNDDADRCADEILKILSELEN